MSKKKFKDRVIGKILTGKVVSGLVKSIPFGVGSLAGNILDEVNGSEPGQVDQKTITPQLIKLCIYAVLAYLVVSGKLSQEDAELFKSVAE